MKDKIAIVTGGSRGIGAAIVKRVRRRGRQSLFYVRKFGIRRARLASETGASALRCPQGDPAAIAEAVDKIYSENGAIDVLVNNAGITRDGFMMTMPQSSWSEVLGTNLDGAFAWTKCAAKKMYAKKSGSIIFVSSVSALVGVAGRELRGEQRGAVRPREGMRRGARSERHTRKRDLPGIHRNRHDRQNSARHRSQAKGENSIKAFRQARRSRRSRPLPRLRRLLLHNGPNAHNRRRPDRLRVEIIMVGPIR